MREMTAKQSTMVSGGSIGDAVFISALVMGIVPLIGTFRTVDDYMSMGFVCAALLSPYYVNKNMSPVKTYGAVALGALIGSAVGRLQGHAVEAYRDYRAASIASPANQTAA